MAGTGSPAVVAVARDKGHHFTKPLAMSIRITAGLGVEGDAHAGTTVKHRSRVARDPTAPNLRQVHLIHEELFAELANDGFTVAPGELGENVTTRGIDLLSLPAGTQLHLGEHAVVEVTGLRNPCVQIDRFQKGLMKATLGRDKDGHVLRKTGVMCIAVRSGDVHPGDPIRVELPAAPHRRLEVV
jgi:MOSC domain-containing protein YiiM